MSYLYGTIANNKVKKSKIIYGAFYELAPVVNKALNKNLEYEIGIDQSTTCTGIHIYQEETEQFIVFDFNRDSTPQEQYKVELTKLMSALLRDLKIKYFVMEKPVPSKYRNAGDVLRRLEGFIESWKMIIPELENVKIEKIFPQSWKSVMVDKSKGKNRHKSKRAVAEDICDKLPLLRSYLAQGFSKDLDGFDAVGILHGFKASRFDENGNRKVSGTMEKRNIPVAFFKYITPDEIRDTSLLFKGIGWYGETHKPVILSYNKSYSFFENIRLCSSNNDLSVIMLNEPQLYTTLFWEFDIDRKDNHYFVMFVCRKSAFTKKQLESIQKFNYCLLIE